MSLNLDISKIHKDTILEYIYNKLDEEQLYSPFIDLELEKRIRHLCEDIYKAGYNDRQETEKLKKEKDDLLNISNKPIITTDFLCKRYSVKDDLNEKKLIIFEIPKDIDNKLLLTPNEIGKCIDAMQEILPSNYIVAAMPLKATVDEFDKTIYIDYKDAKQKFDKEGIEEYIKLIKDKVESKGYTVF